MPEYPIGAKHRKRAAETKAGQLARAMHEAIYCAVDREVSIYDASSLTHKRILLPPELSVETGLKHIRVAGKDNYVDTAKLLREVRDFLEYLSFAEVVD